MEPQLVFFSEDVAFFFLISRRLRSRPMCRCARMFLSLRVCFLRATPSSYFVSSHSKHRNIKQDYCPARMTRNVLDKARYKSPSTRPSSLPPITPTIQSCSICSPTKRKSPGAPRVPEGSEAPWPSEWMDASLPRSRLSERPSIPAPTVRGGRAMLGREESG